MIKGAKILAIVLARGGSKGIPRKNIFPILGRPLIEYTIKEAKKSNFIDKIIVSTDDIEIAEIVKKYGIKVPFLRPKELAEDTTSSEDAILHAINWLESNGEDYDIVILLQPTSPLRRKDHIDRAIIEFLNDENANSLISVTNVRQYPHWMKMKTKNGYLKNFFNENNSNIRRQDIPELLYPNGAIYLADVNCFKNSKSFTSGKVLPFFMEEKDSFDIDDYLDIKIIEMIMNE